MDASSIRGLYGIADADFQSDVPVDAKVRAFLDGGAPVVQIRMKTRPARELWEAARSACAVASGRALILVNDRPDVALAAGADGVHVGDEDLPVAEVRKIVGRSLIVGATVRTLAEAQRAVSEGADYVGFGPVFPTTSKALEVEARGLATLAEVSRSLGAPVVAIGGITLDRAVDVARAGAAAAAVISDVLGSPDPAARARAFSQAFARGRAP